MLLATEDLRLAMENNKLPIRAREPRSETILARSHIFIMKSRLAT